MFDAATQDKIATFLISKKRPRLGDFLAGGETSLDRAMLEMAKEFASIPVPYDVKKKVVGLLKLVKAITPKMALTRQGTL